MAAANKGPKKRTKQLNISTIISGDGRPIRLGRVQEGDRSSAALPTSPLIDPHSDSGSDEGNMPTRVRFVVAWNWVGVVSNCTMRLFRGRNLVQFPTQPLQSKQQVKCTPPPPKKKKFY